MSPRDKFLQLNPSWDNNPSIHKIIDEWEALFVELNLCEDADSENMVEKSMEFSNQPSTTLLPKTPRNAKTLTVKTENLILDGGSVTSFVILL